MRCVGCVAMAARRRLSRLSRPVPRPVCGAMVSTLAKRVDSRAAASTASTQRGIAPTPSRRSRQLKAQFPRSLARPALETMLLTVFALPRSLGNEGRNCLGHCWITAASTAAAIFLVYSAALRLSHGAIASSDDEQQSCPRPPKRRPTPPSKLPDAAEVSLRAFHACFSFVLLAFKSTRESQNSMDIVRPYAL